MQMSGARLIIWFSRLAEESVIGLSFRCGKTLPKSQLRGFRSGCRRYFGGVGSLDTRISSVHLQYVS
jgi:hypothetical protein